MCFSLQFLQDFLLPKSGKTTDDEWVQFFFRDQLICIRTAKLILKPPSWCGHPHPAMCEVLFRIFGNSWKKKKLLRLPMTSSWQRPRNDSGVGKFLKEKFRNFRTTWVNPEMDFSWTRLKLEERKLWSKAEQPTETFADFFPLEVEVATFEYERYSLCFMPMHRFSLSLSAHCGGNENEENHKWGMSWNPAYQTYMKRQTHVKLKHPSASPEFLSLKDSWSHVGQSRWRESRSRWVGWEHTLSVEGWGEYGRVGPEQLGFRIDLESPGAGHFAVLARERIHWDLGSFGEWDRFEICGFLEIHQEVWCLRHGEYGESDAHFLLNFLIDFLTDFADDFGLYKLMKSCSGWRLASSRGSTVQPRHVWEQGWKWSGGGCRCQGCFDIFAESICLV